MDLSDDHGLTIFTHAPTTLIRSPTPGLTMFAYIAEPGSKSGQALELLASWTATPDEAALAETDHGRS